MIHCSQLLEMLTFFTRRTRGEHVQSVHNFDEFQALINVGQKKPAQIFLLELHKTSEPPDMRALNLLAKAVEAEARPGRT